MCLLVGDLTFGLTVLWALVGIALGGHGPTVTHACLGLALLLVLLLLPVAALALLISRPAGDHPCGDLHLHAVLDHFRRPKPLSASLHQQQDRRGGSLGSLHLGSV